MSDHHDLPFKAEYAKSGRSGCKACKANISQDSLRLAIMVQSPFFDGKVPNWFHHACFWKRAKVLNHADIHGFDSLRWDDQQKIKEKIGGGAGDPSDNVVPGATSNDFTTEYAKSNRSTCRGCDEKIDKDEVRISKKEYESERAKMYGPQELWHHVDCFVKEREDLGFGYDMNPEKILGFGKLKKDDKDMLISKLGKGEKGAKRKAGDAKGAGGKKAKKAETEEEKQLREQSQLLWKLRDSLQKEVANNALKILLELNSQEVPSGESKLLDAVSDCMAFGALDKCPECKKGQLVYGGSGYKCTGNISDWTKCMYKTKVPKRKAFKVPKEYHDASCLKSYKYVKRDRVFPAVDATPSSSLDSTDSGSSNKPLEDMKFVIFGKTSKSKADLTKEIMSLGGHVVSKISSDVAACISTKDEVKKKNKNVKEAEKANIQIVGEEFLDEVKKGGAVLLIQKHNLTSWGADPASRIKEPSAAPRSMGKSAEYVRKRDETMFTKSVPSTMKMKVKGGAAVDPDSGLEDTAHIFQNKGDIYNVVLGLVDVIRGTNSFYKLQALESDRGGSWWLFRAWGRVGTTIGGNKTERFGSSSTLMTAFENLYLEKTGNQWANRKDFKKFPNKFYPLDIDYGQEEEEVKNLDIKNSVSKLPRPVQDLVRLIFDVESMKKAMLEFEIDLKKMPLGKLSKKQIENAYKVLTELTNLIEKGGTQTQFLDATNRFYTLVPHDFGLKKPPLLNTSEVIKSKVEMLDNLLEIEVAYSMLKGGDAGEDPIDAHYKKLNTKLVPVEKKSDEYKRLLDYVKNTHAATHNQYDLEVEEIFTVDRKHEADRYAPFRDLHNKMLLWHGSRTTNFAGILSQGLRIAPPEAPVTGYMFGKGIYLADMVSKSANYCRTSKADSTGLLLLCETALGNMYERTGAEFITSLPKGKHSCKGIGMTCPDPKGSFTTSDGVVIPLGKGVDAGMRSSLLYNEYIVYDVAQVNIKYLLRTNFKYKW